MLEIIKRYNEDNYSCKEEIMKQFDAGVAHTIWDEIQSYRKQFQLPVFNKDYLVYCRNVCFAMMSCEHDINQYIKRRNNEIIMEDDSIWGQLQYEWTSLKTKTQYDWLVQAAIRLGMCDGKLLANIIQRSEPLTLRLYLCYHYLKENYIIAMRLLLMIEDIQALTWVMKSIKDSSYGLENDDLTYNFLYFIEQIQLKLSEGMVLLNDDATLKSNLTLQEMEECYPHLTSIQLAFYQSHRTLNHYYTIAQYMDFGKVCYETARYSMEQLVEMLWYQKRKLGKKFVYFIT